MQALIHTYAVIKSAKINMPNLLLWCVNYSVQPYLQLVGSKLQTNSSNIQFHQHLFSVYKVSATLSCQTSWPCFYKKHPPSLPPVTVALLHVSNVVSQFHTLSHSPPALSNQSHDKILHALIISSTITSLLSCWIMAGKRLWIVIAFVLVMLMVNDLLHI